MRNLIPLFFLLIILGIFTGGNIYLTRRFAWFFGIEHRWFFYFGFALASVYMIGGLIAFSNTSGTVAHLLYMTAAVTMGVMLYLLLSFLAVHLLQLVTDFQPKIYGYSSIALTLIVSLYGILNAANLRLTEIDVPIVGLKQEMRVMHLSDLHLGHFRGGDFLTKIIEIENKQKPDLVLLTGDLFDGRYHLSPETMALFMRFQSPVYFVEGNHDGYTGVKIIKDLLRKNNVRVLENEVALHGELQVVGLNHMLADREATDMHTASGRETMKDVLSGMSIDKNKPSVLMHHSPDGIQYANEKGIDLYLAGHTHGGQLFPVNYIGALLFKYNKGLHNYNGTRIFVSQGAGTFGPPMRIGTKSEITLIKLIPEAR